MFIACLMDYHRFIAVRIQGSGNICLNRIICRAQILQPAMDDQVFCLNCPGFPVVLRNGNAVACL